VVFFIFFVAIVFRLLSTRSTTTRGRIGLDEEVGAFCMKKEETRRNYTLTRKCTTQ
jgi:hypothetical protein